MDEIKERPADLTQYQKDIRVSLEPVVATLAAWEAYNEPTKAPEYIRLSAVRMARQLVLRECAKIHRPVDLLTKLSKVILLHTNWDQTTSTYNEQFKKCMFRELVRCQQLLISRMYVIPEIDVTHSQKVS